jgi:ssDNA-binding Zn-finger/Zn-ribbon topoisomerase 1
VNPEKQTPANGAAPPGDAGAGAPVRAIWQQLREPFPAEKVGKLPRATVKPEVYRALPRVKCDTCGGFHPAEHTIHLDFVGHADITDRLLAVDPAWNWEPIAWDEAGLPRFAANEKGQHVGLWIRLTVGGVTRLGYGSVEGGAFDAEKQLIGDALRNAAMRFGVALDLWRKEAHAEGDGSSETRSAPALNVPCPTCGKPLLQKQSKRGPFISCSSWRSREEPGCGFTAHGTLTAFAEKWQEFGDTLPDTAPADPGRAAIVASGECPECRKRGLTSYSGKRVRFVPMTDNTIGCTGYDPVPSEYAKHPTPEGVPKAEPVAALRQSTDPGDVNPDEIPF